ncbi:hypothetical protein C8A01DRAFT_21126 [Parachaetomium inaequale]|uniref:MINDY deubiquitinase domain-containing protein n=1 Tax=Parachaetomium inaequale TaxID=2588326 RepID=A0AAN6SKH0_9PEZI|nr:hypothetical protein C8A01DRAFT_21126 [Parachaetomium inaequale]
MVTRKPLPQSAALDPAVPEHARGAWSPSNTEDEAIWGDGAQHQPGQQGSTNPAPADVPNSLRTGAAAHFTDFGDEGNIWAEGAPALPSAGDMSQVPATLRPGSSYGVDADASQRTEPNQGSAPVPTALMPGGGSKPETNPFKRKMSLSAGAGQGKPATAPNIPPVPSVPVADFSQLSVNESSTNPWQPALNEGKGAAPPVPRLPEQDSVGDNVWASARPSRQPTPGPGSDSPALVSLPSEEGSGGWEEEPKKQTLSVPLISTAGEEGLEDAHAWDDLKTLDKGKGVVPPPPVPGKGTAGADDWNLIDIEPRPEPVLRQSTWENFKDDDVAAKVAPAAEATTEEALEEAPKPPPRKSAELPPPQPPRPVDKSETYQIKNINWHDARAAKNPRTSPILVQNANGPCPLVALVNALTLTTPADKTNTALVETLRSREQVSLGLLLDAVFDELMSERRTQPDVPLPDVTELYDFLKGLHTGMNVNPRYVPTPEVVTAFKRTSLTHLHPTERTDMIPGTFEHTKEMALYSTFSIPLIHGWLPSKDDAVYEAFSRQAASYEDVQNLLFREEELEEKLCNHHQGLSPEEQQIYQDILTIKSFLSISATQLTKSGLAVIKKAMKPGSVAILFRNDHFSTLYRHPQTLELLTLVTDAGYAGHAEVVWESLVDVNGERAEFFSGDFRVVGGATHDFQPGPSRDTVPENWTDAVDGDNNTNWTTVPARRGRTQTARQSAATDNPPLSPKHEQEDRDLALALQLQEEEDERARTAQERHRRESILSEQFIEQQGRTPSTARGGRGGASNVSMARGGRGGASRSTASLASTISSTAGGGRRPTPAQPRPASASTTPHSANGNISMSGGGARPRATTQTVRSLLPPRNGAATATAAAGGATTAAPMTNRPADEGLEDAPPSYEQAAKQLPYVPPAGHPSHPGSTGNNNSSGGGLGSGGPARGGGRQQSQGMGVIPGPGPGSSGGGGWHGSRGGYPGAAGVRGGAPTGLRRGVPPPPQMGAVPPVSSGGSGRERDCVVM